VIDPVLPQPVRVARALFVWSLGATLLAILAAAAWIGLRGLEAHGHLISARGAAERAAANISDPKKAAQPITDFSAETGAAHELTSDPVWRAIEWLPWVGPQLRAVSTLAAAADRVADDALAPLAEVASTFSLDAYRPVDGVIDTDLFERIAAPAQAGANSVAAASVLVHRLDETTLLRPARDAAATVSELLDAGVTATDALARATWLLPSMLGADGERDYLVVFQNNAEWRSLGGIVGAMVVVHTAEGRITLADQGSSSDFTRFDASVLPMDREVERLYGQRPGQWIQNVTQVPDFAVTGALAREMWLRERGLDVDGVISLDPVALSYLLRATGPIVLPTGELLTAENAVQLLLNDVYVRYERPSDQDVFFASAAAAVFTALSTGNADPAALVGALGRAGDERRLLLWSSIPDDQSALQDTTLAGGIPKTTGAAGRFGVYFNDGTGSKMDYYVDADVNLAWGACTVDARERASGPATLTVTITNTAPSDAATSLPEYITGGGAFGVPAGVARTVGYLYLPEGYDLLDAEISTNAGFGGGMHDGRQVLSFGLDLAPGEAGSVAVTVQAPEPAAPTLIAEVTPTIHADQSPTVVAQCG
jgi:hypothetical protein